VLRPLWTRFALLRTSVDDPVTGGVVEVERREAERVAELLANRDVYRNRPTPELEHFLVLEDEGSD
jgi:hypothetical protein